MKFIDWGATSGNIKISKPLILSLLKTSCIFPKLPERHKSLKNVITGVIQLLSGKTKSPGPLRFNYGKTANPGRADVKTPSAGLCPLQDTSISSGIRLLNSHANSIGRPSIRVTRSVPALARIY
jgi:hypothetical protein